MLPLVTLIWAAMLAPLVPLSDALALSWSRSTMRSPPGAFEYGWVRGAGSAAFIAGVLMAGQIAGVWGLPSLLCFTAASLLAAAICTGPRKGHECTHSEKKRDRARLARPPTAACIRTRRARGCPRSRQPCHARCIRNHTLARCWHFCRCFECAVVGIGCSGGAG